MTIESRSARQSLVAALAAIFLLLPSSAPAAGPEPHGGIRADPHAEGEFAPAPASSRAAAKRHWPRDRSPVQVILERDEAKLASPESMLQAHKPGTPLRIGFGRSVPSLASASRAKALMAWAPVDGRQISAFSVVSPEATGVRLGLVIERLPDAAVLRFYAPDAATVFEVSGREMRETIDRNLASGEEGDAARTYWSPVIDGAEITVEIDLPAGVSTGTVAIAAPLLSHLFASPVDTRALQAKIGQSGACNLDAACYTSPWNAESLATARMVFTDSGSSYLCTGTLLADNVPATFVPYFLSANHCISTQTVASTLQTYWFYRASSCNSGTLNPSTQTLAGGAALLHNSAATDTSFLRLNGTPPAGALFAGWSASIAALSAAVTGIHHPSGDLQKISFGTVTGYLNCSTIPGGSNYSCSSASAATSNHLNVVWNQGVTEGGSSGSGLWVTSGASRFLVGQLHGGSSFCAMPTSPDQYGRFDVAYGAALYQWLSPPAVPAAATLIAPSGTISGSPTYSWNAVAAAMQYFVYLSNGTGAWHTAAAAGCGAGTGTCSVAGSALPSGSYTWFVLTWNPTGVGPWSAGMNFTVSPAGPPAAASPIGPTGTIMSTPTYTWTAVPAATHYFRYLSNGALTLHTASEANCALGIGNCSVAGLPLVSGNYTWFVLTWNVNGAGPWSAGMGFTVASTALPAASSPIGPSGSVGGAPTYNWNAVSNASHYLLYLSDGSLTVHDAMAAGCGNGIGTCAITGTALPAGSYAWYVLTWNPNGAGPWSAGMNFTSTGP